MRLTFRRQLAAAVVLFVLAVASTLAQTEKVYVTRTGSKYHRAGCSSLRASAIETPLAEAAARYGPCANCRPPVPPAIPAHSALGLTFGGSATTTPAESSTPSASTAVLITRTGQKYHREGCRTLRNGGIASTLGEASRRFGPCGVCSPPVLASAAPSAAMGLVSPPAAPTRSERCQATTKKGIQCSRNAQPGRSYCWQH